MTTLTQELTLKGVIADSLREDAQFVNRVQSLYALVSVGVSYWRGRRKMKGASVILGGKELGKGAASEPFWQLLPDKWKARFQAVDAQVEAAVAHYTTPAPVVAPPDQEDEDDAGHNGQGEGAGDARARLRSVRLILASRVEEFFGRLAALRAQLMAEAQDFCSPGERDAHLQDLKARYPDDDAYDAARQLVESGVRMSRFGVRYYALPTCLPAAVLEGDSSFYGNLARQAQSDQAARSLEAAIAEPRKRLAAACRNLVGSMTEPDPDYGYRPREVRRLRGDSVSALSRELEAFRSFEDVAADDDLVAAWDDARVAVDRLRHLGGGMSPRERDAAAVRILNADATECLRLADCLTELARRATDEAGMVRAVLKLRGG